jgi:hypothetical protein
MTPTAFAQPAWRLFVLAFFSAVALGCAAGNSPHDGDLHIQSRSNPDEIAIGGFDTGIYSFNGPSSVTILLTEGPADHLKRALIVRMFWKPKAAATPLDETATNATVQYIVFQEGTGEVPGEGPGEGGGRHGRGEVGIYSGGGFLYPESPIGGETLQANIWQATMRIADRSEGFKDTLGPSILRGRFTAHRDDEGMIDAVRRVNIAVSEALGVPRFVKAD